MPGDFDTVKERVDIAQVIGAYVPLKKAGRIYKGLCPFHSEKTPSFTVDPDRRTFKCFGCSEGGDVFTFLEKKEGLSKAEALERLAKEAGVELTRRRPAEREQNQRLYAAHDAAYFYFRQALRGHPQGKRASAYLEERGLREATVEKFGLGYAPDLRDGLLRYLRKKGFSDAEAIEGGLCSAEGGLHDRFRGRLMVPIRDHRGRPIAFAARAMRADQQPKYLNSPTTPLFEKSRVLFAFDLARAAIRKSREAIVVEGQFDAVAAHQAGVANVVASMGTALTPTQYDLVRELAQRVTVAFDRDAAGEKAAEARGRQLFDVQYRVVMRAGRGVLGASADADIFVAELPAGQDPDKLVRQDPQRFREIVAEAKPVVEFLLGALASRHPLATSAGRRDYLREALPLLAGVSDPITRALYLDRLAGSTGVSQEVLTRELRSLPSDTPSGASGAAIRPKPVGTAGRLPEPAVQVSAGKRKGSPERYVVAQLIRFPDQARRLELSPEDVSDPDLRSLFEAILRGERPERYPEALSSLRAELLSEVSEPASVDELVTAVEQAALRVREQRLRDRLEEARAGLSREPGDTALGTTVADLMGELARVTDALDRHTSLERVAAEE